MNVQLTQSTQKALGRRQDPFSLGLEKLTRRLGEVVADPAWTPDLMVFSSLLLLTAAFGRPFSKINIPGSPIYVTEVVLAVVLILLVRRVGVRGIIAQTRAMLPASLLVLLWIAGAVATIRGLIGYGLEDVTHDVALIEYSLVLPIVAAAADTPARRLLLFRVLFAAGLAAAFVFTFVYFVPALAESGIGLRANAGAPVGLYLSLFALPALVDRVEGVRAPRWRFAAALAALVLMSLTVHRSVILALTASLVVLVVLARRRRRLLAAVLALAALAVSVGGAIGIQRLELGTSPPGVSGGELAGAVVSAAHGYVADDAGTAFTGGLIVRGDAAVGESSRQISRGHWAELLEVRDLVPGKDYTIIFWVKPLEPVVARGRVGDVWSDGWSPERWIAAPSVRWQRFQKHLRATRPQERLAIDLRKGPANLRFDGVEIVPRKLAGPSGDFVPRRPRGDTSFGRESSAATRILAVRGSSNQRPTGTVETRKPPDSQVKIEQPKGGNPLIEAIRGTFDRDSLAGGFNENQRWRVAFWRHTLRESLHHPVAGVGFGAPADFVWHGVRYDARRDPTDPNDVTPPHNSFLNLIFRTGLMGAVPFFILLGLAIVRLGRALRRVRTSEDRNRLVSLAVIGTFVAVVASFNGALEGPFMGIFFWTVVGLFLLSDRLGVPVTRRAPPGRT